MKLSVFVVTYNQEKYIRQCLDSILMQEVDFDYEVVIGEDHGTDGTRAICEEYAEKYSQVRLLPLIENLGVAGNWRRVLLECKGDYIAMCEGDDYWTDSKKLQKQVKFMDENKQYAGCFHNVNTVDENGSVIGQLHNGKMNSEYDFAQMTGGWFVPTASICFRCSNDIINSFSVLAKYSYLSADRLLVALISNEGKMAYSSEIMSAWRRCNTCLSLSIDTIKIYEGNVFLFKNLLANMPKQKNILTKRVFEWNGKLALEYYLHSQYWNYWHSLANALLYVRSFLDLKEWTKNYLLRK
ncbi:MAG: glycosyltransferase [Bacteroidales bacterium]|nr:glycosyltransferase [Bacteroidales bacterium]